MNQLASVVFFLLAILVAHSHQGVEEVTMSSTSSCPLEAQINVSVGKPAIPTTPLSVPSKLLMGPGPSTPHPRVLAAASLPLLGHMHPEVLGVMNDIKAWLKYSFQTENPFTIAVSGTGHAAMEASVATVVERGDKVLVGVNGIWGERMVVLASRYGADVTRLDGRPGTTFSLSDIEKGLMENPGIRVVFLVHGESSTGTMQNLDGVGNLCHSYGALLFVDAVCTLGGVPLKVDQQGIDVVYSGSQKCLGAPVGPSPLSLSTRAMDKLSNRSIPVESYYFDMNLVGEYWGVSGQPPKYHHTGMVSNMYALREALAMLAEEGLQETWNRHLDNAKLLWAGLERLGLEFFVPNPADRLPTVTTVKVPPGVAWDAVAKFMMQKYRIEIAGGLGPTVGKVWRIGVMGYNAQPKAVTLLLAALEDALRNVGYLKEIKAAL